MTKGLQGLQQAQAPPYTNPLGRGESLHPTPELQLQCFSIQFFRETTAHAALQVLLWHRGEEGWSPGPAREAMASALGNPGH